MSGNLRIRKIEDKKYSCRKKGDCVGGKEEEMKTGKAD